MCTHLWNRAVLALYANYASMDMEVGMQYKQWDVKSGTWNIHMEHGVKTVESGEHGVSAVCRMEYGSKSMAWSMEDGG